MAEYQTTEQTTTRRVNGHTYAPERMSVPELLSRFADETRALLLLEIKLTKSEVQEKINNAQRAITTLSTGGAVLYAGVLTLVLSAVAALWLIWPLWLSALVVGATVAVIGAIMMAAGRSRLKKESMELTHTKESLRENKQWMKSQM